MYTDLFSSSARNAVLQEWWGVTPDLKEIATDISTRDYRALIPDLYKGKVGVEVEEAKHVRQKAGHLVTSHHHAC